MSEEDTVEPQEARRADRNKTYQGATIVVSAMSTFSCVIKSRSETGFGLKMGSTTGVPDQFKLVDKKTGLTHPCKVVWRRKTALGVQIID